MPLFDLVNHPTDNIKYDSPQCQRLKEKSAEIIKRHKLFSSGSGKEIGKKDLISLYSFLQQDQEIDGYFPYPDLDFFERGDGVFSASDPRLFSIILDAAIEEVGKQPSTSPIRFASIEFPGDAANNLHYRFPKCTKDERGPSFNYLINARFDNCDVNSILNACEYRDYKDTMPVLVGHEKTKVAGVKEKIEYKEVNIANSFFYSHETVNSTKSYGLQQDLDSFAQKRISPAIPPITKGIYEKDREKDQKRYNEEVNKQSSERSGSIFRDHTEPTIYHVESDRMKDNHNPKNTDVTLTETKSDGTLTPKTKTYTESFAKDLSSIVNSEAYRRAMNRSKPSTSPTTFSAQLITINPAHRTIS